MTHILAVVAAGDQTTQATLAAEALRATAVRAGHSISIEVRTAQGVRDPLPAEAIKVAEVALLIGDGEHGEVRFDALRKLSVGLEAVLANPAKVIADAEGAAHVGSGKKIVGITSCPTGIAHTFMAAEGILQAAKALGHTARIETQGSVGARDGLTATEIEEADVVIIAADTKVDLSRFAGKRVFLSGTKEAIGDGQALIQRALVEATIQGGAAPLADAVAAHKADRAAQRTGVYKHLMTGVSYMLPFVVAGGLLIAIAFALGGIYVYKDEYAGTIGQALFIIGAKGGFALMIPILAGFIAYSIADRPGLAPGMIGGMVATTIGAGFLGGIVAGFLGGYLTKGLDMGIKLPKNFEGLKPVLILPFFGTLLTGLILIFVVGGPAADLLNALTTWLKEMQTANAVVLGLVIGGMMAFDMGGPVNKAAYTFATGLIASQVYTPMAAAMAAGMVPPLGLALATKLFRSRFTHDEHEAGNAAAVLGISFITEGAIPFAARDPLRVIPSLMIGAAVAGALSMYVGAELKVPHGGIFVLPIPDVVTHLVGYIVAIVAGTVVTAAALRILKKPVA